MARAIDVIRKVAPKARANYVRAFENGDALLRQHEISTPNRLAHFLAQVLHESGGLTIEWESMNYRAERLVEVFGRGVHSACITPQEAQKIARNECAIAERVYGGGNPAKAKELGNVQPDDGFRYRGGGLMQTTGRANYRRMGEMCGVNFEQAPELIVSAEHALKPALGEWTAGKLNAFADCDDILSISRAINIGNPRSKAKPNGLQDRVSWYAKVRPLIDRVEFETGATPPLRPVSEPEQCSLLEGELAALLGDRSLEFGDQGDAVRALQLALAKLGYSIQGTGYFGPGTASVVKMFQARYGLEPDGIVGPGTARALDRALPARPRPLEGIISTAPAAGQMAALVGNRVLELGDRNEAVRALQLALAKLGYPITATGYFGGGTDTVVKDFQARHGLDIDGAVGPGTAAAIDRALAERDPARPGAGNGSQAGSNGCDGRPLWLIEGLDWVGTKEAAGTADNPAIRKWAAEEGGEIAKDYNHDSIPWCSLYANMVLSKVGLRGTETLWALDWANWGQKLPGPAVGAFAPMKREGGGHIAIVVGRDQNGNLMCLGGNQEDTVNIKPFPAERPLSFRWPEGVPPPTRVGFDTLPLVKSEGGVSTQEA
jgi:uncharacterized protein (TIGR02594 family)